MVEVAARAVTAQWLASRIATRTAVGIADGVTRLVDDEAIAPNAQLPTIRAVAGELGVSVGTVAESWRLLRAGGRVETRRRGGTRVVGKGGHGDAGFDGFASIDLLLCSPDVRLQPRLDAAFAHALAQPGVNGWGRESMVDALRREAEAVWPFEAEAFTTAGGGTEGLWLATRASAEPGDSIAVEEPMAPGYLATLGDLGIHAIGVDVDDDGPLPASLEAALAAGATAFVLQPGGPFAARHALSAARAELLADVLELHDAWIIEDDSLGPISAVPTPTLGVRLPHRTGRVLAFCKAFGIDVRTSIVGGARELVDRIERARSGGMASNSRILQHALAHSMRDAGAQRTVKAARSHYASRRQLLLEALAAKGLTAHSGPGSLVAWVEVPDEGRAALALAGRGIMVDIASSAFTSPETDMLRISMAQLPEDRVRADELADLVARAASGTLRASFG